MTVCDYSLWVLAVARRIRGSFRFSTAGIQGNWRRVPFTLQGSDFNHNLFLIPGENLSFTPFGLARAR